MRSLGLYQDNQSSSDNPKGDGHQAYHLHRRYPSNGESKTLLRDHIAGSSTSWKLGVCDKLPQIIAGADEDDRFPRLSSGLDLYGAQAPRGENKEEARRILAADHITALDLSRLLGKMNAATKAIAIAPLFYRQLQADLHQALNRS